MAACGKQRRSCGTCGSRQYLPAQLLLRLCGDGGLIPNAHGGHVVGSGHACPVGRAASRVIACAMVWLASAFWPSFRRTAYGPAAARRSPASADGISPADGDGHAAADFVHRDGAGPADFFSAAQLGTRLIEIRAAQVKPARPAKHFAAAAFKRRTAGRTRTGRMGPRVAVP